MTLSDDFLSTADTDHTLALLAQRCEEVVFATTQVFEWIEQLEDCNWVCTSSCKEGAAGERMVLEFFQGCVGWEVTLEKYPERDQIGVQTRRIGQLH